MDLHQALYFLRACVTDNYGIVYATTVIVTTLLPMQ